MEIINWVINMSELPEIESVVYFLKPHLINRTIKKLSLEKENILVNKTKEELFDGLVDKTIVDFTRRGKMLLFLLNDDSRLYIHPRMVGQLITCPKSFPMIKHTHFTMELDNEEEFRYIDVRRLGKLYYLKKDEEDKVTGIHRLGYEYDDEKLDEKTFKYMLLKYRKSIKEALLDQSLVAGIGNIYADEILFTAKIPPNKKTQNLNDDEIQSLLKAIREVLKHYIEVNESVGYETYLKGEGKEFENMHVLRLYDSKICPICNAELKRIRISSRGTVYCTNCQK